MKTDEFIFADISGERLWVEVKKIVTGRFAGPVMRTLLDCDVGRFLGRKIIF